MASKGDPDNHNSKMKLPTTSSWELVCVISVTAVTGNKREVPIKRHMLQIMLQEAADIIKIH